MSVKALPALKINRTLLTLVNRQELILMAMICAGLAGAYQLSPTFLDPTKQVYLSSKIWDLAILSVPMTLIILTGGIDLSVGSAGALSAVVFGLLYNAHVPIWIGCLVGIGAGTLCGAFNGWFVAYVRVHPLIVTLATLAAFRGIAVGISHAQAYSGFPDWFTNIGQGSVGGFPIPGLFFIAVLVVGLWAMGKTPIGVVISAIGFNQNASKFSGIPVERIKFALYTLSGTAAGIAAILYVSWRNTAKADMFGDMALNVITAVILGGTSIFGGRGRLFGTVLGIILIHETREFLSWQWDRNELNSIVIGGMLIVSVLADSLFNLKRR